MQSEAKAYTVIRKYKSYNIITYTQMEDVTAKDENENRYLKKPRDLVLFFSQKSGAPSSTAQDIVRPSNRSWS